MNELLEKARKRCDLSRAELAARVNEILFGDPRAAHSPINANYIGKLENGTIRCPRSADYRQALRTALGVESDAVLGFIKGQDGATVEDVNRREILTSAGAAVGAAILGGPAMELLTPSGPTEPPRRVTPEHVAEISETAAMFEQWDNSRGGAIAREIADDRLRSLARLLSCDCPPGLRADLHTAVAQLAGVVAFMLFDAYRHDDARRRFRFALQCAETGGDWHQRAVLLSNMARQEIWCGRADDGLTYVEMGLVRADRLTATERAMLHTVRARALAKLGPPRAQDALAAVGAADEAFAGSRPADDPPRMRFYDNAQHHGDTAHALYDVAMHTGLRTDAASRFAYAVANHAPEYSRSRAISGTKLATLTMVQGDPREAAAIGQRALDHAGPVRSLRIADDLRELRRLAAPHGGMAEVRQLRERIGVTVGPAA